MEKRKKGKRRKSGKKGKRRKMCIQALRLAQLKQKILPGNAFFFVLMRIKSKK